MVFSSTTKTKLLRQDLAHISLKRQGDDVDDTTQVKLGVHARRATVDDVH